MDCALIYCNPRPAAALVDLAVRTGSHGPEAQGLNVVARRVDAKVTRYRRVFGKMFDDVWRCGRSISWLDVGAGYGEVLEAVAALAPPGSRVEGVEPMKPKAKWARERGLVVTEDYLRPGRPKVDIVSVVDVFSHIPDFKEFLAAIRSVLNPRGEVFVETGNLADLERRNDFPGELGLPDHLVFAGESHLFGYLGKAGFEIVRVRRCRVDGLVNFAKNIVKKLIGRPVVFAIPYTSRYRQIQVRARLRADA
jgi:SAM-dependent methyltransferase